MEHIVRISHEHVDKVLEHVAETALFILTLPETDLEHVEGALICLFLEVVHDLLIKALLSETRRNTLINIISLQVFLFVEDVA